MYLHSPPINAYTTHTYNTHTYTYTYTHHPNPHTLEDYFRMNLAPMHNQSRPPTPPLLPHLPGYYRYSGWVGVGSGSWTGWVDPVTLGVMEGSPRGGEVPRRGRGQSRGTPQRGWCGSVFVVGVVSTLPHSIITSTN